jgi:hypothetical protein
LIVERGPVELPPDVATKPPEFAKNLRAMREREVREVRPEHVQSVDLVVEQRLAFHRQQIDEVADGFGAVACPVVPRAGGSMGSLTEDLRLGC